MNNQEDKYIRNRKIIAVAGVVAFIAFAVFVIYLARMNSVQNKVIIKGLNDCLSNISNEDRDTVYTSVYRRVERQNELSEKDNKNHYDAVVREGSCENKSIESDGQEFQSSTFIVDIEEIQYSYRIRYLYIPTNVTLKRDAEIDLGTVDFYCLNEDEMIYPDFGCADDATTIEEYDPITKVVGNIYDGCSINITTSGTSKSGYAIILKYSPAESVYADGNYSEFRDKCFIDAKQYIKDMGIDINDYYIYEKE